MIIEIIIAEIQSELKEESPLTTETIHRIVLGSCDDSFIQLTISSGTVIRRNRSTCADGS